MQIEDIKDDDSLRAWLEEQDSYEVSVTIAARAALRVQPWLWARLAPARRDAELSALPFVWSTITSAVAAVSPTADVRNAAALTAAALDAAAAALTAAALAAADSTAAALAAATADGTAAADAAHAAHAATAAAARNAAAFWDEIRRDAHLLFKGDGIVWGLPLWQTPPEQFAEDWVRTRDAWQTAAAPWVAFARIFDDFWEGREPDWAYLEQIVLINPRVWEGRPEAVSGAIADIGQGKARNVLSDLAAGEVRNALAGLTVDDRSKFREHVSDRLDKIEAAISPERWEAFEERALEIEAALSRFGETGKKQRAEFEAASDDYNATNEKIRKEFSELAGEVAGLRESLRGEVQAAMESFTAQKAIEEPVALWEQKQTEHEERRDLAYRWFRFGLVGVGGLTIAVLCAGLFTPVALVTAFAPPGCDPIAKPELCSGFSFRGLLVTASALTFLTLCLWFVRLQMKEYLSERHLALDARERRAFAQAYVSLLGIDDASEEAREQRALVYAALFRPGSDGIVKEDGGIDPALTAAISKILSR